MRKRKLNQMLEKYNKDSLRKIPTLSDVFTCLKDKSSLSIGTLVLEEILDRIVRLLVRIDDY